MSTELRDAARGMRTFANALAVRAAGALAFGVVAIARWNATYRHHIDAVVAVLVALILSVTSIAAVLGLVRAARGSRGVAIAASLVALGTATELVQAVALYDAWTKAADGGGAPIWLAGPLATELGLLALLATQIRWHRVGPDLLGVDALLLAAIGIVIAVLATAFFSSSPAPLSSLHWSFDWRIHAFRVFALGAHVVLVAAVAPAARVLARRFDAAADGTPATAVAA